AEHLGRCRRRDLRNGKAGEPSRSQLMPAAGSLDHVSPALALLAGLVSFVSPCVLPLVPAYVAYLGSRAGRVGSLSVATAGLASGWTPCIGVTLSAVLSSAVTAGTSGQGLALMVAYCLGLSVPFLAVALVLERARPVLLYVNSHRRVIDYASAAVLLVRGLLL